MDIDLLWLEELRARQTHLRQLLLFLEQWLKDNGEKKENESLREEHAVPDFAAKQCCYAVTANATACSAHSHPILN